MRILISVFIIGFCLNSVAGLEAIPIYSTGAGDPIGGTDYNYITSYNFYSPYNPNGSHPEVVDGSKYNWADVSGLSPKTQWVSGYANPVYNSDPVAGSYIVYSTSFDASPYILNTIDIKGSWASSSMGFIYFNKQFVQTNGSGWNPTEIKDFLIPRGFIRPEKNIIDFVVYARTDIANGVAASISGTAQRVPEPGTVILTLVGLIVGLGGRRCLQKTTQE